MRTSPAHPRLTLLAAMAAALFVAACGGARDATYSAEIRYTAYGIPHIQAKGEAGLGYGVGYANARDSACPLAEHFITLRGERSRHFGPDASAGDGPLANEGSDFFYRLYNDHATLQQAWSAQSPEAQTLLKGYAAGFNRYLQDIGAAHLPSTCRGAEWLPHADEFDMMRLIRYYGGLNGMVFFKPLLLRAQPPSASSSDTALPPAQRRPAPSPQLLGLNTGGPARRTASNAVALGREATDNGRGLLLGNPHLPWSGPLRMHQLHVTIPGKIDAMGATLPGLPLVVIGFTRQFAWTHTTSTAAHSSIYRLQIDPADPTRYLVDGQSKPMSKRSISITVREADGRLAIRTHDFYGTEFGPVLAHPQMLSWTGSEAYAFRDANDDNHRIIEQWYAMNRASTLQELKAAVLHLVGNPWNNTIAADAQGNTVFMNVLPIPNLTSAQVTQCTVPGFESQAMAGTLVLQGNTAACRWNDDPAAPQRGIFKGSALPVLSRTDYVQNSNDSAWLSNPAEPLAGYSPVVSQDGGPQNLRTRIGITQLQARLEGTDGAPGRTMSMDRLQALVLGNRSHLADLVIDDLLSLCPGTSPSADLTEACTQIAAWNRRADLDAGIGYGYFEQLAAGFGDLPQVWRVPFDAADPVRTPRGLDIDNPAIAEALRSAMAAAVATVRARGWTAGMHWGDLQLATRGERKIPIHGGDDRLGIYNVIDSDIDTRTQREVVGGTSYLQVVGFDAEGPQARALLAYSQSADPSSPHFSDQTERFSRKQWITLPFTEAQIRNDPKLTTLKISE